VMESDAADFDGTFDGGFESHYLHPKPWEVPDGCPEKL
jgi:hypothetical protein